MESGRPTERHLLHFQAPLLAAAEESLTFHVADDEYPLVVHTAATRAEARGENALLGLYADDELTHYVEAELPSDAIAMMFVSRRIMVDGFACDAAMSLAIHVPRAGRRAEAAAAMRTNGNGVELHPKLALRAGASALPSLVSLALQEPDLLHDVFDPFETAAALLYQHPGLISLSAENGGTIPSVLLRQCIGRAIQQRSTIVDRIRRLGPAWCRYVRLKDGQDFVVDDDGKPFFTMEVAERVRLALADPLALALKYSQQLPELQGQTWTVQYGTTSREEPDAALPQSRTVLLADQTKWTKNALSTQWGVSLDVLGYSEPVPGGWTIDAMWSSHAKPNPITEEFVDALFRGEAFIRVDVEPPPRHEYRATLPAQNRKPETEATFRVDFPGIEAELRLDPEHAGLAVLVTRDPDDRSAPRLVGVHLGIQGAGEPLWSFMSGKEHFGELRLTARNARLRHLSLYAEFYDSNDKAIEPGPLTDLPSGPASVFDRHATKRFVYCIGPMDTVFGVPLDPNPVTLRIPFPANAAKMRLYWGGLGTGRYDGTVCACGIAATAIFELGLPVFMLVAGAAITHSGVINKLLKNKVILYSIYPLAAGLVGAGGAYIGLAQNPAAAAKEVAVKVGPMVARMAAEKTLAWWVTKKIGAGAVRRAIPFVNAAFFVFDAAVTWAQLGQTIAAIVQSPFYYDFEITRSFDLEVTIQPDPEFGKFPDHHHLMRVQVVYDTGGELRHFEQTDLPPGTISKPIVVRFADSPAAGRMQVFVFFYAENHWQSGAGSSGWFAAKGEHGTSRRKVEVTVVNALIPLSASSVYQHRQSLAFENGGHRWKAGPPPRATAATKPTNPARQLLALNGITVAQKPGMIGYSWQAKGVGLPRDGAGGAPTDAPLFVVQNVSLLEDPSSRHAIGPAGFSRQSGIAYQLACADDGLGMSFFVDPSRGEFDPDGNPAGGHHLRRIALSSGVRPSFDVASDGSWGRFPQRMDSFVYTQGYVAGITGAASKIYILRLPDAPVADAEATMGSLASGEGTRDGLLSVPRAITVALDGRLLVLEQGNGRIQCFDLTGDPVPYFKSGSDGVKSPVLPLRNAGTTEFLDLSVEARGYIFVLGHSGGQARATPEDYRVDIYNPDGTFLVTTPGVAAAKIAVDLARSMFTLNWETLAGPNGRAEPSVSLWLPPPPDELGEPS
jgi:hypothetical protein